LQLAYQPQNLTFNLGNVHRLQRLQIRTNEDFVVRRARFSRSRRSSKPSGNLSTMVVMVIRCPPLRNTRLPCWKVSKVRTDTGTSLSQSAGAFLQLQIRQFSGCRAQNNHPDAQRRIRDGSPTWARRGKHNGHELVGDA